MEKAIIWGLFFILGPRVNAQQFAQVDRASFVTSSDLLPAKVERVPIEDNHYSGHRFLDLKGKAAVSTVLGVATLDAVGTCRTLAANGYEYLLPTQRCAPATAMIIAGAAADISLSYFFHRTGHHRLERITQFAGIANSAGGIGLTRHRGGRW